MISLHAGISASKGKYLPFSKYEIVGLNVTMNDFAAVELFHHIKNFYSKVDYKCLRHHLLRKLFVNVYGIL